MHKLCIRCVACSLSSPVLCKLSPYMVAHYDERKSQELIVAGNNSGFSLSSVAFVASGQRLVMLNILFVSVPFISVGLTAYNRSM